MLVSLIIPCYNEEEVLPILYDALKGVRESMKDTDKTFEFIFVSDGSRDKTEEIIKGFAEEDPDVRFIFFSRNFGKEAGIYAGLKEAKGDYVVLLDADLQHPVESIPVMYRTLTTETVAFPDENSTVRGRYDSVAMYRNKRKSDGKILCSQYD